MVEWWRDRYVKARPNREGFFCRSHNENTAPYSVLMKKTHQQFQIKTGSHVKMIATQPHKCALASFNVKDDDSIWWFQLFLFQIKIHWDIIFLSHLKLVSYSVLLPKITVAFTTPWTSRLITDHTEDREEMHPDALWPCALALLDHKSDARLGRTSSPFITQLFNYFNLFMHWRPFGPLTPLSCGSIL